VVNNGSNKIQWANDVTLNKDYMSFCTKIIFSYKWISKQNHLQIVIKNAVNVILWTCECEHKQVNMSMKKYSIKYLGEYF
jgi:hypothetical protein